MYLCVLHRQYYWILQKNEVHDEFYRDGVKRPKGSQGPVRCWLGWLFLERFVVRCVEWTFCGRMNGALTSFWGDVVIVSGSGTVHDDGWWFVDGVLRIEISCR